MAEVTMCVTGEVTLIERRPARPSRNPKNPVTSEPVMNMLRSAMSAARIGVGVVVVVKEDVKGMMNLRTNRTASPFMIMQGSYCRRIRGEQVSFGSTLQHRTARTHEEERAHKVSPVRQSKDTAIQSPHSILDHNGMNSRHECTQAPIDKSQQLVRIQPSHHLSSRSRNKLPVSVNLHVGGAEERRGRNSDKEAECDETYSSEDVGSGYESGLDGC